MLLHFNQVAAAAVGAADRIRALPVPPFDCRERQARHSECGETLLRADYLWFPDAASCWHLPV